MNALKLHYVPIGGSGARPLTDPVTGQSTALKELGSLLSGGYLPLHDPAQMFLNGANYLVYVLYKPAEVKEPKSRPAPAQAPSVITIPILGTIE